MNDFIFSLSTQASFGEGISENVGTQLKNRNIGTVLVVTDKGIISAGILKPIEKSLKENDVNMIVYDGVSKNPKTEVIYKGVDLYNNSKCQAIIAIGGGSSIDAAKGIGIIISNGGKMEDYEGFGNVKKEIPFLIAIPTTYGTGSEVSTATIITNEYRQYKMFIGSDLIGPKLALIDPNLLVRLPYKIATSTGLDALTHAIESYISKNENPISDALNIYAIKTIAENIAPASTTNCDLEATSQMVIASAMTAIAFNYTALGLVHSIAHALGGLYDIAHGIANALILPYVMEFNIPSKPNKFAQIATAMGENIEGLTKIEAAQKSVDAVTRLSKLLGIPQKLRELNISKDSFEKIAEFALNDGNIGFNPRTVTKKQVIDILNKAY